MAIVGVKELINYFIWSIATILIILTVSASNNRCAIIIHINYDAQVYNAGDDYKPIFSSDAGMNANHSNRDNFSVNPDDFSLTIHNLRLELGAGKYICRSTATDGTVTERVYNLVVRGKSRLRAINPLKPTVAIRVQL